MTVCTKCRCDKDNSEFFRSSFNKNGLQPRCKSCARETTLAWNKAHPEYTKKSMFEWHKKNASKVAARNGIRYKLKRKEIVAKAAEWNKKNSGRHAASESKRRAIQIMATPAWANQVAIREFYALAELKTKCTGTEWHVDHIVPLRGKFVCGLHTHNNLQVIPAIENMRKHNSFLG